MYQIQKDEKTNILYRSWETASRDAVFLLIHGLGAHSGRWDFMAEYFINRNISSYALELKGFGETDDTRGHVDYFSVYYKDINSMLSIIKEENPNKRIFLVGESMGALIAFNYIASNQNDFNGLICISPAFFSKIKFSFLKFIRIFLSYIYFPEKQFVMSFTSQMCTRDIDYQHIMDNDPREYRMASAKLLFNIGYGQFKAKSFAKKINVKTLFLIPGEDLLVDHSVSEKIFDSICIDNKKLIRYPGMYHALSIELGREDVFEDIYSWVKDEI